MLLIAKLEFDMMMPMPDHQPVPPGAATANTLDALIRSPFARLRTLLGDITPGREVIDLGLGEPRHPMPDFVAGVLARHHQDYRRYPPIAGIAELRTAIAEWLARRYPGLSGRIDPDLHILPLTGSREGLFSVLFPIRDRATAKSGCKTDPCVLIPDPFYQAYAAAAYAAGAVPVFLETSRESGFLPDLDALEANTEQLERCIAFYVCTPSNPQGAVASADYLERVIRLARHYGFAVLADECYSEIYTDAPPPGALEVATQRTGSFSHVLSFQSLSKRSNLPGLRSGFCAGDPELIAAFRSFRNVAGPQMPLPVQYASAAVWSDEEHVTRNRALYREKFADAASILGHRERFQMPEGGFFLWLDIRAAGGSEEVAQQLFKDAGIRVLPGRYLSHRLETGPLSDDSSAFSADCYVRIALVDEREKTRKALQLINETLI